MRNAFFVGVALSTVAAFIACVGDDPVGTTPGVDSGVDSPVTEDAAPDTGVDAGPTCAIDAPFTQVERVAAFTTDAGDYGLSFTGDGLTAYVGTGQGSQVVFVHTRLSTSVPFGSAIPLNGMPSDSHNYAPSISADGKELFFTRSMKAFKQVDVYRAEIGGGGAQNVAPAPGINDPDAAVDEHSPFLLNDRVLYFTRSPSAGVARIHRAERATTFVPFTAIVQVSGLGTAPFESSPVVTPDELHIYFAAMDDTDAGTETRIMRASRLNAQMPFGTAVPVDGIGDPAGRDGPLWLSPDRCTLYFLSDRDKPPPVDPDIWVAKRAP